MAYQDTVCRVMRTKDLKKRKILILLDGVDFREKATPPLEPNQQWRMSDLGGFSRSVVAGYVINVSCKI